MDVTADELAGVVDLFGGLTRAELEQAISEAAFRASGESVEETALEETVEDALASYALVELEPAAATTATVDDSSDESAPIQESLFVAGPTAFPTLPDGGEDVPHILDVDSRSIDRERLGETAREQFGTDVTAAVEGGDDERRRRLLDVSYDLEAWAPIELGAERRRLEDSLD